MDEVYSKFDVWFGLCCLDPLFVVEKGISDFIGWKEWDEAVDMLAKLDRDVVLTSNVL